MLRGGGVHPRAAHLPAAVRAERPDAGAHRQGVAQRHPLLRPRAHRASLDAVRVPHRVRVAGQAGDGSVHRRVRVPPSRGERVDDEGLEDGDVGELPVAPQGGDCQGWRSEERGGEEDAVDASGR